MDDRSARLPASCAISVRKRRMSWIYLSERANQKQEPEGMVYRIQSEGSGFDICSPAHPRHPRGGAEILSWNIQTKKAKVFFFQASQIFLSWACLDKATLWKRSESKTGKKRVCDLSNGAKKLFIFDKLSLILTPLRLFRSMLSSTGFSTSRNQNKTPQTVSDKWFNWARPFPVPLLGPTPLSVSDISTPDTFGGGVVVGSGNKMQKLKKCGDKKQQQQMVYLSSLTGFSHFFQDRWHCVCARTLSNFSA